MDENSVFTNSVRTPGRYATRCHVPGNYLRFEKYQIDISAGNPFAKILDSVSTPISVEVIDDKKMLAKVLPARPGVIAPPLKWETRKI